MPVPQGVLQASGGGVINSPTTPAQSEPHIGQRHLPRDATVAMAQLPTAPVPGWAKLIIVLLSLTVLLLLAILLRPLWR